MTILVRVRGQRAGERIPVGSSSIIFGRAPDSDVVLDTPLASRTHAELRLENGEYVLDDRGSRNGTAVNGQQVATQRLRPGDEITIGDETFRFEWPEAMTATQAIALPVDIATDPILRVTVTGGGPVGLSFALLLEELMGPRVAIKIYDGRWAIDDGRVTWKTQGQGNARRQQVVTIQSRQYRKLPAHVQERLFTPGGYSEMWPAGPDSVEGLGPRNIRVARVEDELLAVANSSERIQLVAEPFDAATNHDEIAGHHVLAICEGGRSRTREHFADRFGQPDLSMYSLDGRHVQDFVLGLRVRSDLPDSTAVLLTVAQNRFLLNSLRGEGFLNMRLTEQEEKEAVGIDLIGQLFTECIQSKPCVLERQPGGQFGCATHRTFFLPAVLKGSAFWARVQEGLKLFGVAEENLTAVTGFRLDMVQRPRFTAQLFPRTATTPGTFGFLLGDTANAIHFWPGRGLNSGLASAASLARNLAARWRGSDLRDADFVRHEALMAMLQYRHKSRAWRQMVTTDETGRPQAIKDQIAHGIADAADAAFDREADIRALMGRLRQIRARLAARLDDLPDDAALHAQLDQLTGETLHTLLVSGAWDSANVGGEEVDVDWLLDEPQPPGTGGEATAARPPARAGTARPATPVS